MNKKTHKYARKWYKPKDRKAIKEKRRERRQKVRDRHDNNHRRQSSA